MATSTRGHRGFVFTINNYQHEPTYNDTSMEYLGWAPEVGPECGTPHLQGMVIFKEKKIFKTVQKILMTGDPEGREECYTQIMFKAPPIARGYFVDPAAHGKDPALSGPPVEFGVCPESLFDNGRKAKTDELLMQAIDDIKTGLCKSIHDLDDSYPGLTKSTGTTALLQRRLQRFTPPRLLPLDIPDEKFNVNHPIIKKMKDYLDDNERNIRQYLWIVAGYGNGKSTAIKWVFNTAITTFKLKPSIMEYGKKADLAHIIDEDSDLFLFDIPKSGYIPYTTIEAIRSGHITSGKYGGKIKYFKPNRKIIICSNTVPDPNKISCDMDLFHYPPPSHLPVPLNTPMVAPLYDPPPPPPRVEASESKEMKRT